MMRYLTGLTVMSIFLAAPLFACGQDGLGQKDVRDAAAKVAPSVVQIETVGGTDRIGELAVGTGPTTGLLIDTEGYVVSSSINFAHSPSGILVRLANGQRLAAQLVATDHHHKIALLKIDTADLPPAPIVADVGQIRVGQWAIAVGRAFDSQHTNVSVGIISALGRVWGKALQTDAAVSPNNYGGPLINLRGEVVGLLVPMSPASDEEVAGVEWYDSGIGFAVPADLVLQAASRLKSGEDLYPGLIGMTMAKSIAMSGPPVVSSVLPNSPAEKGGLEKGDRIVRIGKTNIAQSAQIKYELASRYAGDTLNILVRRGNATVECEATLVAELEPYRCPVLGILPFRDEDEQNGIAVRQVLPGTPADRVEITAGDRIISFDSKAVADADDLRTRIARRKLSEKIVLEVERPSGRKRVDVPLQAALSSLPEKLPAAAINPEAKAGREVSLALPEYKNQIKAYLPKGFSDNQQYGLLIWMRSATDEAGKLELWKQHADGRRIIVVLIEPASADRWLPGEADVVRDLSRLCRKRFSLDPNRLVVGGQAGGGTLAYRAAARQRDEWTGCIAFDARLAGPRITDHPEKRFHLLIGRSDKGRLAEGLDQAAGLLRKGGLPVIVLQRSGAPDRINDQDAAAVARWIDLLDLI